MMSDDVTKLESELAAMKADRERKAAEREAASKTKRLAAEIAKQKQLMADDEKYAELLDEYGQGYIRRINTPLGMVVVKGPEPLVLRKFRDEMARADHPNPRVRQSFADSCDKMARHCVVYPDKAKYEDLAEKFPTLTGAVVNEAIDLGNVQVEEDSLK